MPYDFISEDTGVVVRFFGTFTYSDNYEATIELYAHKTFDQLKYIIWDFSDVTTMDMTEKGTRAASVGDKMASNWLSEAKVALITQDDFTRGLCETYISQCRDQKLDWEFMIADTIQNARDWVEA